MNVYDDLGQLIAHLDADGTAHGDGARVTVTVTVHRDGEGTEYDLPSCRNSFCSRCWWPQLHERVSSQPAHMESR